MLLFPHFYVHYSAVFQKRYEEILTHLVSSCCSLMSFIVALRKETQRGWLGAVSQLTLASTSSALHGAADWPKASHPSQKDAAAAQRARQTNIILTTLTATYYIPALFAQLCVCMRAV